MSEDQIQQQLAQPLNITIDRPTNPAYVQPFFIEHNPSRDPDFVAKIPQLNPTTRVLRSQGPAEPISLPYKRSKAEPTLSSLEATRSVETETQSNATFDICNESTELINETSEDRLNPNETYTINTNQEKEGEVDTFPSIENHEEQNGKA